MSLTDQIAAQYQDQMGYAPSQAVLDYFTNSIGNQGATMADLGATLQAAGGSAYNGGSTVPSVVSPPPPTFNTGTGTTTTTTPATSTGGGTGWNDLSNQIAQQYQTSTGNQIQPGTLAYFTNDLASGRASWADLSNTLQGIGGKALDLGGLGYGAAPTDADKTPSTSYLSDMVKQAYNQAMGKDPTAEVLDYFVRDLASGKANWSDLNNTLSAAGGKSFNPASFGYSQVPKFQTVGKGQSRDALMAQIAQMQQQLQQLQAQIADMKAKIAAKKATGGTSPLMAAASGSGAAGTLGASSADTSGLGGGLTSLAASQQQQVGLSGNPGYSQSNVSI